MNKRKKKKKEVTGFDINKPLDRLFIKIMNICDALNTSWALGCTNGVYSLTIGYDENQRQYEGDIKDIELFLLIDLPWRFCIECNTRYYGGQCQCKKYDA